MWRAELDKLLYKALEVQYRNCLENMHHNLPEIKVDLVFNKKQLAFRPPLEELKTRFYREIKTFVSIPSNFAGVGGNVEIYKKMPDSNSDVLLTVYSKAESLFM